MRDIAVPKSGFINHKLIHIKMDLTKMANGVEAVTLRGYTIRSLSAPRNVMCFTVVEEQGKGNWRGQCSKCQGEGDLTGHGMVVRDDILGRGNICFACQGRGWFVLPKPEVYRDVVALWILDRFMADEDVQIAKLCNSEWACPAINMPYYSLASDLWQTTGMRILAGMDPVQEGDEIYERLLPIYNRMKNVA